MFLKNKNIIFKIRRSKVTDYAALRLLTYLDKSTWAFHYFLANADFCRLVITFANSLDPDQDQQNIGPDLDKKKTV